MNYYFANSLGTNHLVCHPPCLANYLRTPRDGRKDFSTVRFALAVQQVRFCGGPFTIIHSE